MQCALGLLGAILGTAGAVIAGLAWAHGSLSATFGDLPLSDVLILLVGLPLVAAVGCDGCHRAELPGPQRRG